MPPLQGLVECALYVEDLARSQAFYERVCGFREIFREEGRLHALSVAGRQVLLLFARGRSTRPTDTPGGRIPPHDGHGSLHVAFAIGREQVEPWRQHLHVSGVSVESEVDCPGGGHSIYFRDPDGHLVELITPGCWQVY